MSREGNIILYGPRLFEQNIRQQNLRQLEAVRHSGFTTAIFWTLHVDSNGDFYYNDTPIVKNGALCRESAHLPDFIAQLKKNGTVDRVLFSLGSCGATDFYHCSKLLATARGAAILRKNFQALCDALPIDGFDIDIEEYPLNNYIGTVVKMTLMLHHEFHKLVTYRPYSKMSFWLDCLERVCRENGGMQIVSWLNLQCFGEGSDNHPGIWASHLGPPHGVDNPAAFVVPGYHCRHGMKCEEGNSPGELQGLLAELKTSHPDMSSSFLWNSRDIFSWDNMPLPSGEYMTTAAYAQAMIAGLGIQAKP